MKNNIVIFFFTLTVCIGQSNSVRDSLSYNDTTSSNELKIKMLPFAFYDNSLGVVFGGIAGVKGVVQKETFLKVGGIISTSKTCYGFMQIENFQLPFFPRLFFRPDIYLGQVNDVKLYLNKPKDENSSAGANDSQNSEAMTMEGDDQWYEFNVRYLLPIGHGKNAIINPIFKNGTLVGGETGGTSWNPFKSGRMFLESKLFYRHMDLKSDLVKYNTKTLGVELAISHENMDYYFNPTVGNYTRITYSIDWGAISDDNKFSSIKYDYRFYLPLYDINSDDLPCVLAFNFVTMDTPSWYDYDLVTSADGKSVKVFHRPQLFVTANLGGEKKLRAFTRYRFYDKSLIYYSAELRKNLGWNPFNSMSLTKKIGIDFIQLVAFADLGRVAPQWNIKTLHEDMKWSAGGGLRLFMDGLLVRIDLASGSEGVLTQMFVDHPF